MYKRHIDPQHPNFRYSPAVVESCYDLNQMLEECKTFYNDDIIVVNDIRVNTEDEVTDLLDLLMVTHDGGEFGTPENGQNPLFEPLFSRLWIKPVTPNGKFIHPKFLTILQSSMCKTRFDIVRHVLDPSYRFPDTTPTGLALRYLEGNYGRGFDNFYREFDRFANELIIEPYYARLNKGRAKRRNAMDSLAEFILKYRDLLFCDMLPIPSRHAFVMEQRNNNKLGEVSLIARMLDAINTVTSLHDRIRPVTAKEASRLDYKINFTSICQFHMEYNSKQLMSKSGIFRRNSYGTPTTFTSRAVIASRHGVHRYDEMEVSYPVAFKLFELHIAKRFIDDKKYTPMDIFEMRATYAKQFNPEVHKEMQRLCDEYWGGRGWSASFLRFPYLTTLSSQNFYIPGRCIGVDPLDTTFKISSLVLAGFNADFDGDEMVITLHIDYKMKQLWSPTLPHHSAMDVNRPYAYSGLIGLPKAIVPTINRFMMEFA